MLGNSENEVDHRNKEKDKEKTKGEQFQPGEGEGGWHNDEIIVLRYRKGSVGERKPGCPPIQPRTDQGLSYSTRDLQKIKEFLGQIRQWVSEGFCVITFSGDG